MEFSFSLFICNKDGCYSATWRSSTTCIYTKPFFPLLCIDFLCPNLSFLFSIRSVRSWFSSVVNNFAHDYIKIEEFTAKPSDIYVDLNNLVETVSASLTEHQIVAANPRGRYEPVKLLLYICLLDSGAHESVTRCFSLFPRSHYGS